MSPGNLKNSLLGIGPYLSDIVLLAIINRSNPLPPGILKDIIIPNSPLSSNVMSVLNTKNLPSGIKSVIQAVQTGISARTILEQQITELMQNKDLSISNLINYYMNDSVVKFDSIIIFFKTQTDNESKRQLVQAYLMKQDCSNAANLLNQLPQITEEDIAFNQFYSIIVTLCNQGKTILELTPLQLQTLSSIESQHTSVSTSAKSILTIVKNVFFPEIIDELKIPDSQTLYGNLFSNPNCNNYPLINDTIVLLDSVKHIVNLLHPVLTNVSGYFKFNFNDLIFVDQNAKYTFGTTSGGVIQDTIFKTIQQWITASPVNLNLKKLKAGFINDTVACFSDSVHFTNKTMFGKKPYTYNWSLAFHAGSTLENPVYKYINPGTFSVNLKVTDALGCNDSIQHTVIIPAPVIAQFTTDSAICKDSLLHIINTSLGTQLLYLWEYGDGLMSTFQTPEIFFTDTGTQIIRLTVTDNHGCTSSVSNNTQINNCFIPTISGTLYESADCGGYPVFSDTLVIKDNSGNIVSTVTPAITNEYGEFNFFPNEIQSLNNTALYSLATKSGFEIQNLTAKTISQWLTESPVNLNLTNINQEWVANYSNIDSILTGAIQIDLSDNVYVSGNAITPNFSSDIFLAKYNPSGMQQWTTTYNGTGNSVDRLTDMVIDRFGNIYILTNNIGTDNTSDYVILKYDPTGNKLWESRFSASVNSIDYPKSIAVDATGAVYSSGFSYYNGKQYISVLKCGSNGALKWIKPLSVSPSSNDYSTKVIVDRNLNIFVAGFSRDFTNSIYKMVLLKYNMFGTLMNSSYFDYPTNIVVTDVAVNNLNEIYFSAYDYSHNFMVYKTDNNCQLIWNRTLTIPTLQNNDGQVKVIAIDANSNINVSYSLSMGFGFTKYDNAGNQIYQKEFATQAATECQAISTDNLSNVYLTGFYLTGSGKESNIITVKYSESGDVIWEKMYNGGFGDINRSQDIAISNNNNVYIVGQTFNNEMGISTAIKYSQCPASANSLRYSNPSNNDSGTNETTNNQLSSVVSHQSSVEYVQMFPNPNDGNFYFNYSIPENEKCQFTVFDPTGKKVYNLEIKGGKNTVMVNHNNFSKGVYYYQVTSGNRLIKTERLVITK